MTATVHLLLFTGTLFCTGLAIVLTRKDLIRILIGIEFMLTAAGINLAFTGGTDGRMSALFLLVIAVCEAAVGLAIFMRVFRFYRTSRTGELNELKERP